MFMQTLRTVFPIDLVPRKVINLRIWLGILYVLFYYNISVQYFNVQILN